MKKIVTSLLFCGCFIGQLIPAYARGRWQQVDVSQLPTAKRPIHATRYLAFTTDEATLRVQLFSLSKVPAEGQVIELPMADGTTRSFKVWQSPMMPVQLADRYPGLRTFTGEAIGDASVTVKLDFTLFGFHAIIFDKGNISFIDPSENANGRVYIAHYKKDETREWNERTKCVVTANEHVNKEEKASTRQRSSSRTGNGYVLRTYRLALACDNFYAQAATGLSNPAIAQTLSAMITSMNRINGVYEREFSITMNFVANEDTLIWTAATGTVNGDDPYNLIDADAYQCLTTNQTVCDSRIGDANYDIGHVFTTGAGGLSQVGVACQPHLKAQSVTGQVDPVGDGFDIDYVSHEMGHEYGADHPFNSSDGNCGGANLYAPTAFEPGSGSTIMAYAGICAPDDLQPHSDAYFHSISLEQIQTYINDQQGNICPVTAPTYNKLVSMPSFAASYTIPYLTPFELTAPAATDSVADTSITYCWEQWNLGNPGETLLNTHVAGPIFRSYYPATSTTRIFPENSMVLAGVLSNAGIEGHEGEKAPDSARFLTFQLTIRDIYQGNGCFLIPDDTVHIDVINTGEGFKVTSQDNTTDYFIGTSPETITWNVAGTNAAPINTANVDIYMSADGGDTWQYSLGTFPNTGSAVVILPNPDTDLHTARIKVKGTGNVFFNVNSSDFTVTHFLASDTSIVIYPVPASTTLRLFGGNKGVMQGIIYNSIGQQVWVGEVDGETDLDVSVWARGIYFIRLVDIKGHRSIKKFVVG